MFSTSNEISKITFYSFPKEIILIIASFLNLKEMFELSITCKKLFNIINNINIKDPYLGYVLLSLSDAYPLLQEKHFKIISAQNANKPLLILCGNKMSIHGFSSGQWKSEELNQDDAKYLNDDIQFPPISIHGYQRIFMLDEKERFSLTNFVQITKKSTLLLSLKIDGTLKVIGHHPQSPINKILFFDKEDTFYQTLPAKNVISENMKLIYDITTKCGYDKSPINAINNKECLNLKPLFFKNGNDEIGGKVCKILDRYNSFIIFKDILQFNHDCQIRLDKISEFKLKQKNTFFMSEKVPIKLDRPLTPSDIFHLLTRYEGISICLLITFSLIALGHILATELPFVPPTLTSTIYYGTLFYVGKKIKDSINENAEIEGLTFQNQQTPNPFV